MVKDIEKEFISCYFKGSEETKGFPFVAANNTFYYNTILYLFIYINIIIDLIRIRIVLKLNINYCLLLLRCSHILFSKNFHVL